MLSDFLHPDDSGVEEVNDMDKSPQKKNFQVFDKLNVNNRLSTSVSSNAESNSEEGLAQLKGELGEQLLLNGIDPENLI